MKINNFREIDAWKEARILTKNIYSVTKKIAQLINGFIRYLKMNQRINESTNQRLKGFTFIELLITLSVVAICFLPLMQMFSASLEEVSNTGNLSCGRYLVQEGMERLKNLGFTEAQVEAQGDLWEPGLDKGPLELNGKYWRTLRKVVKGSDPLEVHILAYQETLAKEESAVENAPRSLVLEAATLLEDLDWST